MYGEYGNTPQGVTSQLPTIVSTLLTNQGAASGRVCGPGGGASDQKNRDITKECAKATMYINRSDRKKSEKAQASNALQSRA